ncbi:ATP-binding protein, partial [Streptomyces sp. NPDC007000]
MTRSCRELLSGALIALLVGWLVWSLLANGYLGGWWLLPLELFTPDAWRTSDDQIVNLVVWDGYTLLVVFAIMIGVGRLGRWGEVWRRFVAPRLRRPEPKEPQPALEDDPAGWPALRAA